jgi:hypothetical protein
MYFPAPPVIRLMRNGPVPDMMMNWVEPVSPHCTSSRLFASVFAPRVRFVLLAGLVSETVTPLGNPPRREIAAAPEMRMVPVSGLLTFESVSRRALVELWTNPFVPDTGALMMVGVSVVTSDCPAPTGSRVIAKPPLNVRLTVPGMSASAV